jgi:hypothetical protein
MEVRVRHIQFEGDNLKASEYEKRISSTGEKEFFSENVFTVSKLSFENKVLKYALQNLREMFRLSNEYAVRLEEAISPKKYGKIEGSLKSLLLSYAREPRCLPRQDVIDEARVVLLALKEELGSDEIADMLNLDVVDVDNALNACCVEKFGFGSP